MGILLDPGTLPPMIHPAVSGTPSIPLDGGAGISDARTAHTVRDIWDVKWASLASSDRHTITYLGSAYNIRRYNTYIIRLNM